MIDAPMSIQVDLSQLMPRFQRTVIALQQVTQTPLPIACHALVTALTIAANLRPNTVTHDGVRNQPLILMPFLVAVSGTAKSPTLDMALEALIAHDAPAQAAHARASKAARRGSFQGPHRLVAKSSTYGALLDQLAEGSGMVALVGHEFHHLKRAGLLGDGRLAQFYDGDSVSDDTRTHGFKYIEKPRLIVSMALQPHPFRRALDRADGDFHRSGDASRLLLQYAEPINGFRSIGQDTSEARQVLDEFRQWFADQLKEQTQPGESQRMAFTVDALAVFLKWRHQHEVSQQPGNWLSGLLDAASKAPDKVIRLAGIFERFETSAELVGPRAVQAGIALTTSNLWAYELLVGPVEGAGIAEHWAPRLLWWLRRRLPVAYQAMPELVLKEDCPPEICSKTRWKPALLVLRANEMLIRRGEFVALTPRAWPNTFDAPALR